MVDDLNDDNQRLIMFDQLVFLYSTYIPHRQADALNSFANLYNIEYFNDSYYNKFIKKIEKIDNEEN